MSRSIPGVCETWMLPRDLNGGDTGYNRTIFLSTALGMAGARTESQKIVLP